MLSAAGILQVSQLWRKQPGEEKVGGDHLF